MAGVIAAVIAGAGAGSLLVASAGPAVAQDVLPFGPGERAEYKVTLGVFGEVGTGVMAVTGVQTVHGHPTYHLRFDLRGRVLVGSVDDTFESWMDVEGLFARRFHKRQHEITYDDRKRYDFFPDSMIYRNRDTGNSAELATPEPLDEVSFLYYVRTLPLEPGDVYTLHRYYKNSGNPVVLRVLRREIMTGPDGAEVPVVVVQPIIRTSGLFGEGGEAEVYFTDDWRRILVKMSSRVPIIGRLGLSLTGYTPGTPVTTSPGS